MQSTDPKETEMKTKQHLTTTYLKVATTLTALAGIALSAGMFKFSDETLKQDIEPVGSALDRLRQIG